MRLKFTTVLISLLFLQTCKTTPPTVESIKAEKEVTEIIKKNEKVKKTNNVKLYKSALSNTENYLQKITSKFKKCEIQRAEDHDTINELKKDLNTWTIIKWTFWITVTLGGIFGVYLLTKKLK